LQAHNNARPGQWDAGVGTPSALSSLHRERHWSCPPHHRTRHPTDPPRPIDMGSHAICANLNALTPGSYPDPPNRIADFPSHQIKNREADMTLVIITDNLFGPCSPTDHDMHCRLSERIPGGKNHNTPLPASFRCPPQRAMHARPRQTWIRTAYYPACMSIENRFLTVMQTSIVPRWARGTPTCKSLARGFTGTTAESRLDIQNLRVHNYLVHNSELAMRAYPGFRGMSALAISQLMASTVATKLYAMGIRMSRPGRHPDV
jgi:hypothetical protein